MKKGKTWSVILFMVFSIALILTGGAEYLKNVNHALWKKSVTDILEITTQGSHALDTYIEKDSDLLHWLATELAGENSTNTAAIQEKVSRTMTEASDVICIDLDSGIIYTGLLNQARPLEKEYIERFEAMQGQGIREPFLDGYTGIWTLGYYECFFFADGARGFLQKTQPLAEIADRFSLSFYSDTGFSYVVNREGKILIRSQHINSNRTFQNLFDIIDLQDNEAAAVESFRTALSQGQRGVARFEYKNDDYVFCYVPMETATDWYAVSIVPNSVIMEQSEAIIQNSRLFLLLVLLSILIFTAFVLLYRNSTQRILRAEEAARKSAESANMAKSRFLSNMSHDIRTPMNAVIGMTQLALDHIDEPEKTKKYLKNIHQSGQLLMSLINDILDVSKIESGKMVLNNDTASLERLLVNLVSIIYPGISEKKQMFEVRLHRIEHEILCFDTLRLNQILINLLSNAVKFTPAGGSICLDVTESPSLLENHTHLTLQVSDTGIGMKPEFLEQIFHSFSREQDSTVNKIQGSGLGMTITKMIVDLLKGTISIESTPGKGSVFTVDLDLLLAPGSFEKLPFLPPVRILIAEDDPVIRSFIAANLTDSGVTVNIAESGSQTVEMAVAAYNRKEGYDLILLDWDSSLFHCAQTALEIQKRIPKNTPVLIATAYDMEHFAGEISSAGMNGFLQKPAFRSSLHHCIHRYVLHAEEPGDSSCRKRISLSGRHILLAEDNELNQLVVQELLSSQGALITTVGNGQECVNRFAKSSPGEFDLILMDIQMPVMNGYEATKQIRHMNRSDASIPIFAMTADAFTEDIKAAKQSGMNVHLSKPLDIQLLLREIQKYQMPVEDSKS